MRPFRFASIPILLLLAACSRNDNPAKWVLFSRDTKVSLYYTFDRMSKTDENIVKIWVKTVYGGATRDDAKVSYSKNIYVINCGAKTYAVNPGVDYSPSGEIVSMADGSQPDQALIPAGRGDREAAGGPDSAGSDRLFSPIVPDSAAGRLYPVVCR